MKQETKILQDALIKNNVLTQQEADECLAEAEKENLSFREYAINSDIVNEQQIIIALSQCYDLETIDFRKADIDQSLIKDIPIKIAWYYKFIPVSINNSILTIASSLPIDIKTQDEIRMHTGFSVSVLLAKENDLNEAFKKYYGFASDTIDRIMMKKPIKEKASSAETGQWVEDLEKQTEDPTVAHLVNQIILEAYKKRATDIHIEPYRNKVRFRYRIDGVLVDANLPNEVKHFLSPILSRIKILANLSITEKRLPQDGSAVVKTKDQHLDLRVSTMPTPRGESMVIRILPTKVMLFSLEKLGFNTQSLEIFRGLIQKPHGIIFITGPTGSGKTTSLYACLNEINTQTRKIITIEDPVEYEMEGITQIQVNTKVNFDFATGLRSLLRHDPDIIMVGEVRDLETAEIAIRTALTGHLVFSTLHTNDAASGITRLVDMGVEPYLVASSVEAFVAQRLVRVICPKCKEIANSPMLGIKEEIARSLKLNSVKDVHIYVGRGCDYCNMTGYYGRMAIYETLVVNDVIRAAVLEKPRSDYIKRIAVEEGLITLRQNGWQAVLEGSTTPSEVMDVTVKDEALDNKFKMEANSIGDAHQIIARNNDKKFTKKAEDGSWSTQKGSDTRAFPRCFAPVPIRYRVMKQNKNDPESLLSDNIEFPTVTEDISAGGIRFKVKGEIEIGTILEVKIHLGESFRTFECLAKVKRVEKNDLDELYYIIACYLDISSANRASIGRFVDSKLKEEEKSAIK